MKQEPRNSSNFYLINDVNDYLIYKMPPKKGNFKIWFFRQTSSAEEGGVMWWKAPEQPLNGPFYQLKTRLPVELAVIQCVSLWEDSGTSESRVSRCFSAFLLWKQHFVILLDIVSGQRTVRHSPSQTDGTHKTWRLITHLDTDILSV